MEWTTLDRLREEHGYAAARFVRHWKTGEELAGGIVESEIIDGERMWRVVPKGSQGSGLNGGVTSDESTVEVHQDGGKQEHETASVTAGETAPSEIPLDEAPIHGRTLKALSAAGLGYSGDVVRALESSSTRDQAIGLLTDIKGVGDKGAAELVDWLLEHGLEFDPAAEPDGPPSFGEAPANTPAGGVGTSGPNSTEDPPPSAEPASAAPHAAEAIDPPAPTGRITFGDLEVGDEFEFEVRPSDIRRYRKTEREVGDGGDASSVRNCVQLEQQNGAWIETTPAYFRDEAIISFVTVEIDLPNDVVTCDDLVAYCADKPGQVVVVWTPPADVETYKRGMTVNVATRHLDGTWTWARLPEDLPREFDVAMRACSTCGQHHDVDETCVAPPPAEPKPVTKARPPKDPPAEVTATTDAQAAPAGPVSDPLLWPDEEPASPRGELDWPDEVSVNAPAPPVATYQARRREPPYRCIGREGADSEAWHKLRSLGIGSSDAGAIIGVSPHATVIDVWLSKHGEPERARPWLDVYSSFGTWFEPYLLEHCALISGVELRPGAELGTLQSTIWPVAQTNLDGLDELHGVPEELKTTSEEWTTIPESFVAQTQHQMFVTGAHEVRLRQYICPIDRELAMDLLDHLRRFLGDTADQLLADWLLAAGDVVTWIVERDERYIEQLIAREREFWAHVGSGTEPTILDPDGTADLTDDAAVYAAVYEYARHAGELDVFKPLKKVADEKKKEARRAIERAIALLEDSPKRVVVGDHKATLVVRDTHSYWNIYHDGEADDGVIF